MLMKNLLTIFCLCLFHVTYSQYCVSGGPSQTADSNTERVILNGISSSINYTGCPGQMGVEDLTTIQQVTLAANSSYIVAIKFGTCGGNFAGHGEAWIDFNGNGIFETNESIAQWQGTPPMTMQNFNFIVPAAAVSGITRMRVMQHEGASGFPLDPCASFTWGSVVDFSVIILGGSNCTTINTFPYTESFESFFGLWTQETTDSIDWTRISGATSSANTGPTSASDGNFYIYTEASGAVGFPNKVANILSPCFDLTTLDDPKLTFMYHMYGATMGTLNLQASVNGGNWTTIWTKTGDQGDSWLMANVDLIAYTNETELRFRFNGTTGSSFTSDIAIDAISINCTGYAGDNQLDAIPVPSYPYTDTGSTANCYNNFSLVYNSPDVFYLAVLDTLKDSLKVSLCGSDFDTHLAIQDMDGNVIYYNDDAIGGCSPQSEILFPTEGLDSLYIVVEGWGNYTGTYIINIDNDYVKSPTNIGVHYIAGQEQYITIYPNPTRNSVTIEGIIPEQIYVFSIDGKLMPITATNTNAIDLSALPSGIYILDLIYEGEHFREKIIKE